MFVLCNTLSDLEAWYTNFGLHFLLIYSFLCLVTQKCLYLPEKLGIFGLSNKKS